MKKFFATALAAVFAITAYATAIAQGGKSTDTPPPVAIPEKPTDALAASVRSSISEDLLISGVTWVGWAGTGHPHRMCTGYGFWRDKDGKLTGKSGAGRPLRDVSLNGDRLTFWSGPIYSDLRWNGEGWVGTNTNTEPVYGGRAFQVGPLKALKADPDCGKK